MKIMPYAQGSTEWLAWRAIGISASDEATILGLNPYKTPWRLWAEMTGFAEIPRMENNPCVRRGKQYEPVARDCAVEHFGQSLRVFCAESSRNPIIRASFDGVLPNGEPVELKCPYPTNWKDFCLKGVCSEIYRLYYPQVQQQIYVSGAERGWLFVYSVEEDDYQVIEIERDEIMIADIIRKAGQFYMWVLRNEPPPKDPERDVFIPSGRPAELWLKEAVPYCTYEDEIKKLEDRITDLKSRQQPHLGKMKQLMKADGYTSAEFASVRIVEYETAGKVDYDRMLADNNVQNVDPDKYRKPKSQRTRVTVTGQVMPKGIKDKKVADSLKPVAGGLVRNSYF